MRFQVKGTIKPFSNQLINQNKKFSKEFFFEEKMLEDVLEKEL